MPIYRILKFLRLESSSGIILLTATIFSFIWANSPFAYLHKLFIDKFLFLINEGLMAVFFLIVGLELKREYLNGQLARFSQIALPAVAALGGILVPALIYGAINWHNSVAIKGWATPVATDIAFSLAVLSLFGRRVPIGLKLFLLALAIFDDVGAIIIIALFYSSGISYFWLLLSAIVVFFLYILNLLSVRAVASYLSVGVLLWFCLLRSGVHPTIAGVLLALTIPGNVDHTQAAPLQQLENNLHPWVVYLIMPLFALANAGISLGGLTLESMASDVVLGITLGLFVGKQLGVFCFSWLLVQCRIAKLPEKVSWSTLYGVSLLCGIGFTMSLFLGTLSFQNESIYLSQMRVGVVTGSLLSGLVGGLILLIMFAVKEKHH